LFRYTIRLEKMTYRVEYFKKDGSLVHSGEDHAYSFMRFYDNTEDAISFADGLADGLEYRLLQSENGTAWEELK
jgi:hypothetical protein